MLQMFRRTVRSTAPDRIESIDPQSIPFLNFDQLIQLTNQTNRLRSIRRLVALDIKVYAALYEPALIRYVESAQLQPASEANHHAYLGGLIIHTLEVVEHALKQRQKYLLPKNAAAERILEEEHVWTYAIFAGALLHDAGKLLTLTRIRLPDGSLRCPFSREIDFSEHYAIMFTGSTYSFQTKSAGLMFGYLPEIGLRMLSGNIPALAELTGWLFHEPYEWGTVGQIVETADSHSVSLNIRSGGSKQRLPNARQVPLVERFIRVIRHLIQEKELSFNRNGAAGWIEGDYTYMVCKTVVEAARTQLQSEGSNDIPSDNPKIFTMFQDHGYIVPTPRNKAVWHVTVKTSEYEHSLTMLKFETSRIFHPSMKPSVFTGAFETREYDESMDNQPMSTDEETAADSPPPDTLPQLPGQHNTQPAPPESDVSNPATRGGSEDIASVTTDSSLAPAKIKIPGIDDPDIATAFLDWVRHKIEKRQIQMNKGAAPVHTVPKATILVSPEIFKQFLIANNLQGKDEEAMNERFRKLQKHVLALRKHLVNATGNNMHYVNVSIGSGFHALLFPHAELWGDLTLPKHNELLELKDPEGIAPASETAAIKKRLRDKKKQEEVDANALSDDEDDFELEHES